MFDVFWGIQRTLDEKIKEACGVLNDIETIIKISKKKMNGNNFERKFFVSC
jgi:hypothetical protein